MSWENIPASLMCGRVKIVLTTGANIQGGVLWKKPFDKILEKYLIVQEPATEAFTPFLTKDLTTWKHANIINILGILL